MLSATANRGRLRVRYAGIFTVTPRLGDNRRRPTKPISNFHFIASDCQRAHIDAPMAARPFQRDGLRQDPAESVGAASGYKGPHQPCEAELTVEDFTTCG